MDTLKRELLAQRVRQVKPSGIRKFFDIINTMPDVISLGVGEPDFVTPEHIRQAGIRSIELGHTRYTSNYGILELREEIAAMLKRRYGIDYDPKTEILVTVGVSEGVDLAMRTLIDPGDEVISPDPGYVAYEADIVFAGGKPVPVPTYAKFDFGVRAEEIAAAITPRTKMILIGNPNNPTGGVVPRAELEGIAKLAQQHDLIVAIDEVYSRLVYDIEHVSIAAMPGMRERTVLLDGFSKAYAMTGWRIGYSLANADWTRAMSKVQGHSTSNATSISQAAAVEALNGAQDSVATMLAEYTRRREWLLNALNEIPGLKCPQPEGAFYAFPDVRGCLKQGETSDDFATRLLEEEQTVVTDGAGFGAEGFIRISYATSLDRLKEGVERIKRVAER